MYILGMGYFLVVRILGVLLPNNMLKVEPPFFSFLKSLQNKEEKEAAVARQWV